MTTKHDLSTLAGRVAHIASRVGGGAELSRRADMSQSTLSRITRGNETTVGNLLKIFEVVEKEGVTLDWLLRGKGSPETFVANTDLTQGHFKLRIYGYTEQDAENEAYHCPILFEESWFKNVVSRFPKRCFAFQALDSEIQCINKGAWTTIDTGLKEGDGIYLIKIKNAPQIRRLQFMPTGEVNVRTNGEAYKNYTLNDEQMALIEIVGRVVWWENH